MNLLTTDQKIKLVPAFIMLLITGCVENFDLPVKNSDVNFLVVDGFLNTANGEASVNLLRASVLSDTSSAFEAQAIVALEDSEDHRYALAEQHPGQYKGTTPAFEPGLQYRLYVKTADGKEYRSAFITLKSTPAIKEVSWKALSDGTQIIVDTGDETNTTRYYRWVYEETWEYHSRYSSYCSLAVSPDTIIVLPRPPAQMIDICYRTQPTNLILSATTNGLSQDQVNDFELAFLPKGTQKLGYRYSILVKQYAISRETYEYLERLKKTSQDLGGIFAPQPSKVTGNLSNITDPAEVVLGYFNAGEASEKRIFISPEELPQHLRILNPDPFTCRINPIISHDPDTLQRKLRGFVKSDNVPLEILQDDTVIYGITITTKECADCRVWGGKTSKPIFWP